MWVAKLLLSPVKLGFSPKTDRIWPKLAFLPGLAGSFGALLVVVARGLYLARHLFSLLFTVSTILYPAASLWLHSLALREVAAYLKIHHIALR